MPHKYVLKTHFNAEKNFRIDYQKELTEEQLRQWISEPSLARGRQYHRLGRIVGPHIQGNCLKASCLIWPHTLSRGDTLGLTGYHLR